MHPHLWLTLLVTVFFNALSHVDCKSYFGIGNRFWGDQILMHDDIENRHTGLTEVPVIEFSYPLRHPITSIEIMSNENVLADVKFSYYNEFINGTVTAFSTSINKSEPFKVSISIYGFNESKPAMYTAELLRPQLYYGPLRPELEPGVIDHMENGNPDPLNEDIELLDNSPEEDLSAEDNQIIRKIELAGEVVQDEGEDESETEEDDTFESFDKFIPVGARQKGDYLLFESYQTSSTTTERPANHSVTFYYIDSVFITYIQFVIIDYHMNKTTEESNNSYMIEYSHFTPNTLKAVVRDYRTTSLFAKMDIYGYNPKDVPADYVSYVPQKKRGNTEGHITTESPEMLLRSQINALQREGLAKLPSSFGMLRHEGEFQLRAKPDEKTSSNNANTLQSKITNLSVMLPLGIVIAVYSLWSTVVLFD